MSKMNNKDENLRLSTMNNFHTIAKPIDQARASSPSILPNLYVEQFNVTILTAERANLKLRIRFKGKYLLAISEAIVVADGQITQIDYREAEN